MVPLVGKQVLVNQVPPRDQAELGRSGRGVDFAVVGLNPLWPLLLTGGWRSAVPRGTAWRARTVLEREGEAVTVDAVDDPWALEKTR